MYMYLFPKSYFTHNMNNKLKANDKTVKQTIHIKFFNVLFVQQKL